MRERILSFLAYLLIKIICKTISFKTLNRVVRETCLVQNKPFIYAFWHGRQFLLLGWNQDKRLVVMTSLSRDGRLQDRTLTRLGLRTVAGSSSRGGMRALVEMVRRMQSGGNACFAVDGPRGPLHIVKPGAVYLASRTGSVIIPLTARAKYHYVFNKAWDKYEFPLPFSPAVVILGQPIEIPSEASESMMEQKRQELEQSLLEITNQADGYFKPYSPNRTQIFADNCRCHCEEQSDEAIPNE